MMWAEVRANWPPLRDQIHHKWSKLSHDDIRAIAGHRRQLIAFIRLRYDIDEVAAASEADNFVQALQVLSL